MENIFGSSSSSSSDDEIDEIIYVPNVRRVVPRINNFLETVVQNCNNREFQQHFRVSRVQFQNLLLNLAPMLEKQEGSTGRLRISAQKQLMAVLWLLATPDSYRSVGCRFNMGKSSLFACFFRVVKALNEIAPQVIKWPDQRERQTIKENFRRIAGLPGVVGAVDGTYVPIKAPQDNPEVYINRKCFHAITLQAICTPDLKFTDCFTGFPSSVSDIRIFRNSDIYNDIENHQENNFGPDEHIGDKAYPVLNWCIPPYVDRGRLTQRQRHFNTVHAQTRQVIERAFSLLFGRFRRLRYLDMNRVDLIPSTIIAACTIHNLCLSDGNDNEGLYIDEGCQQIIIEEENDAVPRQEGVHEGQIKRDYLAGILN